MDFDVILLGDYWYDLVYTGLRSLPQLGDDIRSLNFGDALGGSQINAVALHRLGLHVGWAGEFGSDRFSQMALAAAEQEGLDASLFRYRAGPYRRVNVSLSFPSDRAFISFSDPVSDLSPVIKTIESSAARAILIPGLNIGVDLGLSRLAPGLTKTKILMDCQFNEYSIRDRAVSDALRHVDAFLPNAMEAQKLTGTSSIEDALKILADLCALVVIKDGVNGAYAAREQQLYHASAIPIQVLDTTGAGDCFASGFLKAWLDAKPIEECMQWGNICGGLSCTMLGGATSAPTLAELTAWLNKHDVPVRAGQRPSS